MRSTPPSLPPSSVAMAMVVAAATRMTRDPRLIMVPVPCGSRHYGKGHGPAASLKAKVGRAAGWVGLPRALVATQIWQQFVQISDRAEN